MAENKMKMDAMLTRAVGPSNVNAEARTADVVFATDTPVRTYSWSLGGEFEEVLSFDPAHVRMDRLKNGAPVLDNHNRWGGTTSVLGVVEAPTLEANQGRATLRFSKRESVDPIFQDVVDGILKGVSVGYRVYKYEDMNPERKAGEMPRYRAIDWEPMEISLAPVQADYKSSVRNENAETIEVDVISTRAAAPVADPKPENQTRNSNNTMSDKHNEGSEEQNRAANPVNVDEVRNAAIQAERKRAADIRDAVRKAKLGDEFATELIDKGTSIEAAREAIIEKFAAADVNEGQRNITVGADEADKRRDAITDALVLRAMPEASTNTTIMPAERVSAAREFRGMTMLEIARESLERAGVSTRGMDKMEMVGRAFTQTQSDFPVLLEGTNRRVLLAAYATVADTWRRFCAVGSVGDFREYKRLRMGSITNLDALGEGSEFKQKKITDADYEKISIGTKGNIIAVTRQMIINDDLAGLTRLATMLGRAAARSIEADVYALLLSNSGNGPNMVDGNPLFHASHGNIGTGAALSVSSIDADRVLMAQQKEKDGNDFLGLTPSILVLPIGLGGAARVINGSQYDTEVSNKFQVPNKVNGLYREIVDTPRLTGTTRYSFADPMVEPVLEVAFLDGQQAPYLESQNGWNIDGTEWKVRLDYGVSAVGYRGIVKNAGA